MEIAVLIILGLWLVSQGEATRTQREIEEAARKTAAEIDAKVARASREYQATGRIVPYQ